MIDDEKKAFQAMLNIVFTTYDKPKPNRELLIVWWSKLSKHDFNVVRVAMDKWLDESKYIPTPKDILDLCRPQPTFHQRLSAPVDMEASRKHADEVVEEVAQKLMKIPKDYRTWAKKILADPKSYPDIAIKFAREAMSNA